MNIASTVLLTLLFSTNILADTGDYMWNQRFQQKIEKAETGDTRAQYEVGNMLMKGQGTSVNEQEAFKWFEKSADAGYTKSQYKLGFMYLNGKGTKKNEKLAFKYLSAAAKEGYGPAQYQLGRMYATGNGVGQDYDEAVTWYQKAVNSNYNPAKKALENAKRQASNSRQQAARPAPARPAPARQPVRVASTSPRPAVTAAPAPSSKGPSSMDISTRMGSTYWMQEGRPTPFLPSAINSCQVNKTKVICQSAEVTAVLDSADVIYTANAELGQFKGNKSFVLSYKRDFKYVMPLDPDDPTSVVPFKEGPEKTASVYNCTILSDRLIRCKNDKGKLLSFTQ
jgi:TPR repeat protein